MELIQKFVPFGIVLTAVIIGVSECLRVRYVRYVRYSSGYDRSSESSSLSAGAVAAIVVGSTLGPIILTVYILCCISCCKKKEHRIAQAGRAARITRPPQAISTIQPAKKGSSNFMHP